MRRIIYVIAIVFFLSSCESIKEMYREAFSKPEENEDHELKEIIQDFKKKTEDLKKGSSLEVEAPVININSNDKEDEYIEDREPTQLVKEIVKESLIESNNCPQEISQEFQESTFKEKFTSWQYITLINILCNQEESGIKITINYRSLGTTALQGFFADWTTVIESAKKIFQSAFNFPQVMYVELHFYNPYLDEFGNLYLKHEVTMQMDRELAKKINWVNIDEYMLWRLLDKRGLIKIVDGEEIREK